jgi:hypothetical protein
MTINPRFPVEATAPTELRALGSLRQSTPLKWGSPHLLMPSALRCQSAALLSTLTALHQYGCDPSLALPLFKKGNNEVENQRKIAEDFFLLTSLFEVLCRRR